MAVYTNLSDGDLAELLADYDIGQAVSLKGIAEGVENSNYLLTTQQGKYILTLYEKRVNPEDLPFFLHLMEHLAAKGVSCPLPMPRRDGALLSQAAGRPAAIISFLDGMSYRRPTVAHCREMGIAMAELHLAGADFDMRRDNSLSVNSWPPLFEASRDRADEIHPGLEQEISSEMMRLQRDWPSGLPQGIIHGDLFADNVFFLGDRLSGIIDFYFACTDALAYDLAIVLNAWCFEADVNFNITKAQALFGGYQSVRKLSTAEIEALPVLASGAAMRFLLTRLYDWFNHVEGALVKPKNPLDYMRRLRFHNRAVAASDYGVDI